MTTVQTPLPIKSEEGEKITEPSKRWRNRYRALVHFYTPGNERRPGEVYDGSKTWPSKEIAEEKAEECRKRVGTPFNGGASEYLGAFPSE